MTIVVRALATVEFTVGNWSSHKTLNVSEFNDTVRKEATQHLKHHLKSSNVAVIGHPKLCLVTLNEYRELPSTVVESIPDPNRGRIEELEGQVKILNEQIADLNEENTSLEQNVSTLREEKQSLLDAENDMAKRLRQLEDRIADMEADRRALLAQRDALQNEREHLNKNVYPELRAKIDALETENRRLRTQPVISTKLNPIQQNQVACLLRDTPRDVMNSRWDGILLADLSRHEIACALYRTMQDVANLQAQNMELIAAMHDLQDKMKHEPKDGDEIAIDNVNQTKEVSIDQVPANVIDAIQDLARRTTPLAGQVVFESNAGAMEPNWQTDGVVQHVGFDQSKPYPRFWSAAAYIRQDGPKDIVSVMFDGSEAKWHPGSTLNTLGRYEMTKEFAEAIFNPNHTADIETVQFKDTTPRPAEPASDDMPF